MYEIIFCVGQGYNTWDDSGNGQYGANNYEANSGWDPNSSWDNNDGGNSWDNAQTYQPPQQQSPPMQSPPEQQQQQQQQVVAQKPGAKQTQYYKAKEYDPNEVSPLEMPQNANAWVLFKWRLVYPIHYFCRLTTPDCRQEKYRSWYPFTFCISMLWISFYSYIMVWMITVIGKNFFILISFCPKEFDE